MFRKVDISHKTIFFITGFLLLLWLLFLIRDIILVFFVAIIFMSALSPIVNALTAYRIPKALAIAIVYILIIGLIAMLLSLIVTPLFEQTANLSQNLPATLDRLIPQNFVDRSVIQQELGNLSHNALTFTLAIFNNFITLISIAVLTFYLLLERDKLDHLISQFFIGNEDRVKRISQKIEEKLGSWMRGQIVLSFTIGLLSYIILSALGVPYALPLSILAGLMEVVPVIGPLISAVPAILVALSISPVLALMVAGAFFIIQQAENHFIVPQVMKRAVGLNPLIVILAVAVGGRLLGIAGALLAVPIAVVIHIITQEILGVKDI